MEVQGRRRNLGLYPKLFGFPFYYGVGLFASYGLSIVLIVSRFEFVFLILTILATILVKILMRFFYYNDTFEFSMLKSQSSSSVFYSRDIKKILNRLDNEI